MAVVASHMIKAAIMSTEYVIGLMTLNELSRPSAGKTIQ
jgi:hypothetical protein